MSGGAILEWHLLWLEKVPGWNLQIELSANGSNSELDRLTLDKATHASPLPDADINMSPLPCLVQIYLTFFFFFAFEHI